MSIVIREVTSESDFQRSLTIRTKVFISEQQVPEERERDRMDDQSKHFLAMDGDIALGTMRIRHVTDRGQNVGKIERLAVLKQARGKGVGAALLQEALRVIAQKGWKIALLSSQETAVPFYEQHGFVCYGEPYIDAGIPHRWMRCAVEVAA